MSWDEMLAYMQRVLVTSPEEGIILNFIFNGAICFAN